MKKLYILILASLLPLIASGQALKGSYFSEYSVYRNKLNPAFVPRSNYLGFAAIDNIGFGLTSNMGMSTFLYPSADGSSLQTFLHPDVSAETFLKKLPANPYLDVDFDTDILNIGFFTSKNSFWSIGLGLKVDAEVNLPSELFKFLKLGAASDPQEYNINDLSIIQNAYAELSLGYSRNLSDIVKGLTVGGRVKFLAAIDRVDARINNLNLRMASDEWVVKANASVTTALKGLDLNDGGDDIIGFDFNTGSLGLAGMGAAFDLGAEYRLYINRFFDSVRFSAAVTDLGFISYNANAVQQLKSSGETQFVGIEDMDFSSDANLNDQFNQIADDMMKVLDFEETPASKMTSRIRPNLYLGAEIPFLWNRMSLGLLYSAKFGYTSTRNELTLSLNMRPGKWVNIGVNYSMLHAAKSIGWLLELTPRSGVGFFIGSDYTYLEVANMDLLGIGMNLIPVNQANLNFRFGCHIAMGNKYDAKGQARRAARN